jgi:membrane protein YdbS with pleckstrin-like domain
MDENSVAVNGEDGAAEIPAPQPLPPAPTFVRVERGAAARSEHDVFAARRRMDTGGVAVACALATAGILWLTGDVSWIARLLLFPGWLLVTLGIGWLSYAWPAVHYRHVSYTLDDEGIEIRTGVWWRQVMSVPRSRVQHIDVSQGP